MKVHIYAGYLTEAGLFDQWCTTRETADSLFLKCRQDYGGFNEHAMEAYAKRMKLPWRKKISIDYLPYPKDELGAVDTTRKHTIFALRDYDFTGPLIKFSSWSRYQETDKDRGYKAQIEDLLGFELGAWTIVSSVGHQGLFYDFSPEIIPAIYDLMRQRAQSQRDRIAAAKAKEESEGTVGTVILSSELPPAVAV
ncbi:unnamed protein product [Rhizoctonia solani]|uniref:Uncharacterized protein n=1 Tax=Rhizoctonia solani TaxID=456999 RepID=A0A8H3HAM9_9AGAM|nr:unnamed protein product [Rhizoctonia solani]